MLANVHSGSAPRRKSGDASSTLLRACDTLGESMTVDTGVDTTMIRLSPRFLAAVRRLAPRRRGLKTRHLIALAFLVVAGVLAADRSTRLFAVEKGRALVTASSARLGPWRGHHSTLPVAPMEIAPAPTPASTVAAPAPAATSTELEVATPRGHMDAPSKKPLAPGLSVRRGPQSGTSMRAARLPHAS
jgi:hypothetical protein